GEPGGLEDGGHQDAGLLPRVVADSVAEVDAPDPCRGGVELLGGDGAGLVVRPPGTSAEADPAVGGACHGLVRGEVAGSLLGAGLEVGPGHGWAPPPVATTTQAPTTRAAPPNTTIPARPMRAEAQTRGLSRPRSRII